MSTGMSERFSSAFWGDWTRVEVRKIALESATRNYLALTPEEIIGVAVLYAEYLETGSVPATMSTAPGSEAGAVTSNVGDGDPDAG
jgi:hypothetical protein